MRENADRNNSKYVHFLRSVIFISKSFSKALLMLILLQNYALFNFSKYNLLWPNPDICSVFVIFSDAFSFFSTLELLIFLFLLSNFTLVTGESVTLQYMMILSRYHGNNQNSYELSAIYVEGTKILS